MEPTIYFVIPCYNEEAVLPETTRRLTEKLEAMRQAGLLGPDSRILYVNDGSKDRTWEIIRDLARQDEHFLGICQSRNRGHQNAVLAGLMEAKNLIFHLYVLLFPFDFLILHTLHLKFLF